MDCPECKLVNPSSAARCDCGYDFTSSAMPAAAQQERRARIGAARASLAAGIALVVGSVGFSIATFALASARGGGVYWIATGALVTGLALIAAGWRGRKGRS